MSVKPKELLKTGMTVRTDVGNEGVVWLDVPTYQKEAQSYIQWKEADQRYLEPLKHYDDNLLRTEEITKDYPYSPGKIVSINTFVVPDDWIPMKTYRIWERQEPREMTIAEIEQALGYPVKIVKEKAAK